MRSDEREVYGDDAQDAIAGLRRLAQRAETPPELRAEVMARVEPFLPSQPPRQTRWWAGLAAWRPHPLAWGPAVAAIFFIAGALAPWPHAAMPLKGLLAEKRSAPFVQQAPTESLEVPRASPAPAVESLRREFQWVPQSRSAPAAPFNALARREAPQAPSPTQRDITTSLPVALYEQLQQEAQRRQMTLAAVFREAVEAYVQSHSRAR